MILSGVSVVATLVVGSDGSTSKESRSAGISSPEDRRMFLQRRREVDVIIVGGNTARHEPYNRTPVPLVVISRSLVNPVQGNHLALFWNCSPVMAIATALLAFKFLNERLHKIQYVGITLAVTGVSLISAF